MSSAWAWGMHGKCSTKEDGRRDVCDHGDCMLWQGACSTGLRKRLKEPIDFNIHIGRKKSVEKLSHLSGCCDSWDMCGGGARKRRRSTRMDGGFYGDHWMCARIFNEEWMCRWWDDWIWLQQALSKPPPCSRIYHMWFLEFLWIRLRICYAACNSMWNFCVHSEEMLQERFVYM